MKKTACRILLSTALTGLLLASCINDPEEDVWSLGPGDPCPQFAVTLSDGSEVTTASLAGQTTMIVFFDTSCPDCQQELPVVQTVYDRLLSLGDEAADKGILCISRAEPETSVAPYWESHSLTLPYSAQPDRSVYNLFASSLIPRIYVVSPTMTITHAYADFPLPSAAELSASLGL